MESAIMEYTIESGNSIDELIDKVNARLEEEQEAWANARWELQGGVSAVDSKNGIVRFYQAINEMEITPARVRTFLESEGAQLAKLGKDYYYQVRERFNEKHARFVCHAALVLPGAEARSECVVGTCEGTILEQPRGRGGFGYDPVFLPTGERAAMAELPPERKNAISHRARAFAALAQTASWASWVST